MSRKTKRKLNSFKSTEDLFDYINDCLANGKAPEAGELFENYLDKWYESTQWYKEVYNTNNPSAIPNWLKDHVNLRPLLKKGNSIAIDRICVRHDGGIEIHQDKSGLIEYSKDDPNLPKEKRASLKLAALMMSTDGHPLKNIDQFVLNTTLFGASAHYDIWEDRRPAVRSHQHFVPNVVNESSLRRDELLWKNIRKRGGKNTNINLFESRGQIQDDYIAAFVKHITKTLKDGWDRAECFAIGVGALGKGVMDPVMMARIQRKLFYKYAYTKTKSPVSVIYYHSTKVLMDNGWEAVMRRRGEGIFDDVLIMSGTMVHDKEADDRGEPSPFYKAMNVREAAKRVRTAIDRGQSVLILALYHHSYNIELLYEALRRSHKGFRFWHIHRDECDWPAANNDSAFSWAFKHDAVVTTGSSGTELHGCPIEDHGTNNVEIHGPCVFRYTWAQAENDGLVKPLVLLTPTVMLSEIREFCPEVVNEKGEYNGGGRVNFGHEIGGVKITVEKFINTYAFLQVLYEYPEIKRVIGFSHRVKTNALIADAIPDIIKYALRGKRNNFAKRVRKLYCAVLNNAYNSNEMNRSHEEQISEAKGHEAYLVSTCRAMSRGYNDLAPAGWKGDWKKHHAAIHFDVKSLRDMVQEIWRAIRLDDSSDNPWSYYICPVVINDLGEEPTKVQSFIDRLTTILVHNENVKDDILRVAQGNSSRENNQNTDGVRVPMLLDWEPEELEGLITHIAFTSKGQLYQNVFDKHVEVHDEITKTIMDSKLTKLHNKFIGAAKIEVLKRYPALWDNYSEHYLTFNWWMGDAGFLPDDLVAHFHKNRQAIHDEKNRRAKNTTDTAIEIYKHCQLNAVVKPRYIEEWEKAGITKKQGMGAVYAHEFSKSWEKKVKDAIEVENASLVVKFITKNANDLNNLSRKDVLTATLADIRDNTTLVISSKVKTGLLENNFIYEQAKASRGDSIKRVPKNLVKEMDEALEQQHQRSRDRNAVEFKKNSVKHGKRISEGQLKSRAGYVILGYVYGGIKAASGEHGVCDQTIRNWVADPDKDAYTLTAEEMKEYE